MPATKVFVTSTGKDDSQGITGGHSSGATGARHARNGFLTPVQPRILLKSTRNTRHLCRNDHHYWSASQAGAWRNDHHVWSASQPQNDRTCASDLKRHAGFYSFRFITTLSTERLTISKTSEAKYNGIRFCSRRRRLSQRFPYGGNSTRNATQIMSVCG